MLLKFKGNGLVFELLQCVQIRAALAAAEAHEKAEKAARKIKRKRPARNVSSEVLSQPEH